MTADRKRMDYFATVLPGLEQVLEQEICAKITDAVISNITRGKVFFATTQPMEGGGTIRTADNIYRWIAHFPVGPHKEHLKQISEQIARIDAVKHNPEYSGMPKSFKVNASRTGKHTYSRFDAAEAAMQGISRRYPRWIQETDNQQELEFRLDIDHDQATFALRLTDSAYRYRGKERSFAPAALRPTVAHALVWLTDPSEHDVFLDPFCGSGTLICERAAYPAAQIIGGDLSEEAVQAALRNLPQPSRAYVSQWDARKLPLDAASVDYVVTNLPFGRQILQLDEIAELYSGVVKEMARVLKPGGKALLLTEAGEQLRAAAEELSSFAFTEVLTVSLKGLQPKIYRLEQF